ncbi:hypothetical protein NUW58_g3351 [Xylaria curta]|uniref:Uncharacterized protein n=1 Tax=Xylaria curta TaxID=42375 RepID=A0ACC1PCC6_9PEZI|nr:hypothetical protein NUW58_g3351 [Xylaria curta]
MALNSPGTLQLPLHDAISPGPLSPGLSSNSAQASRTNPLSSKITSVLSTSYADSEFREALALLDARGTSNSAVTRRQLRLDVQKEVIDSNGQIINEFGRVADQLRRIGATVDRLNKSYQEMKSKVTASHEATAATIGEASSLMTQKKNVETKQQLLKAFREHFILSDDEVASLTLTSEPVDDQFFIILAKAKRIRKDCEVLLGFENQTLGLEIMDQTSKNLNQAFQKLYRWIQKEFKTLNLENPQIHASVRRALRVLAERPSLFQSCLDFFAESVHAAPANALVGPVMGCGVDGGGAEHSEYLMRQIADAPDLDARRVSRKELWVAQLEKLVVNAVINPLTAVLRCKNGEIFVRRDDILPAVISRLVSEAAETLSNLILDSSSDEILNSASISQGATSEHSADESLEASRKELLERFSTPRLLKMVYDVGAKVGANTSSMLQDVRAGKPTEIDDFNGWLVDTARLMDDELRLSGHENLIALVKSQASLTRAELCASLL